MQRKMNLLARRALQLVAAVASITLAINLWLTLRASHRIFHSTASIPPADVGIVLGTSRLVGGRENAHFRVRIDSAATLFKVGRVKHLLLSGDNKESHYNEPRDMRDALIDLGVPPSAMTADALGLRTLDSMVRAREKFGVSRCIIISDDFHLPRALWLADLHGISANAFVSRSLPWEISGKTRVREWFARVNAVIDELTEKEPAVAPPRIRLPVTNP